MLDSILEEDRTYQDMNKSVFILKLGVALDKFKEMGDTYLYCYEGHCNSESCHYKCMGFSFIGNKSGNFMDLIINVKDGIVQDIYECLEFKISAHKADKKIRIYIDPKDLPF